MKSYAEALEEFNNLLGDDPDFLAQWGYCEGSQSEINPDDERILTYEEAVQEQKDAFFEWCSSCEDLKHITKENEVQ